MSWLLTFHLLFLIGLVAAVCWLGYLARLADHD